MDLRVNINNLGRVVKGVYQRRMTAPQARPPPIASVTRRSPGLIWPRSRPTESASGIDAAENAAKMVDAIRIGAKNGATYYFAPEMSLLLDRNRLRAAPSILAETENSWLPMLTRAAALRAANVPAAMRPLCLK